MSAGRTTKWRTLALATSGFALSFLIWFSFSPFTGPIGEEFGLSLGELGLLASAAMWLAPPGRILTGWLTDRFGASTIFAVVLAYVGVFSIVSGLVTSYWAFFLSRLIVATSGVTFVIGIQHVSQWFPEEQLGTAEGIYGLGNAGAAAGALVLPRAFGSNWRAAFVVTGVAALVMAAVYYLFGEDAATEARAEAAREGSSLKQWVHVATRYGVVALALAYTLSFGIELSMNGWLPTYFREAFGADLVLASTFASAFALAVGLFRPVGGIVSDRLVRARRDILPVFPGRYREQWTFVCMCCVLVAMCALTAAGRTGDATLTVAATFLVGMTCGWTSGAIFAQVPAMFPDHSGTVAGIVGGLGTFGGIGFPLVYSYAASNGDVHGGYAMVAVVVAPIVLLNAYVYRPELAKRANVAGFLDVQTGADPED